MSNNLLYINYVGEYFYIIQRKLKDIKLSEERIKDVYDDIVMNCFNEAFFENLGNLTPDSLIHYIKTNVNSRIIRATEDNLNRIFIMAVMMTKFMIFTCNDRFDSVLTLTYTHLYHIQQELKNPTTVSIVDKVRATVIKAFSHKKPIELIFLRSEILNICIDFHWKINVLLGRFQDYDGKLLVYSSLAKDALYPSLKNCGSSEDVSNLYQSYDSASLLYRKNDRFVRLGVYSYGEDTADVKTENVKDEYLNSLLSGLQIEAVDEQLSFDFLNEDSKVTKSRKRVEQTDKIDQDLDLLALMDDIA